MAKEIISDGPAPGRTAAPAAAVPMVAKMAAPTMAPMPSRVTWKAPRSRRRETPDSALAMMSSSFLVWKMPRSKGEPPRERADPLVLSDGPRGLEGTRREHDTGEEEGATDVVIGRGRVFL